MLNTSKVTNFYIKLNNVDTCLLNWGDPFNCNDKDVVVCITGNPGLPEFYTDFGNFLHKNTDLPVCVIGHSGHDDISVTDKLTNKESLLDLKGQLKHKMELIKLLLNKDDKRKLHIIGHSIGAWMVTELIHEDISLLDNISSINLLFPTMQKMAETRNGKILNNFIRKIHKLLIFFLTLVYLLPQSLKLFLISMYLKLSSLPQSYIQTIDKFLNPKVVENVLFLAYDEMDTVKNLNIDTLSKMKDKTYVVYGTQDNWAPLSDVEGYKKLEPELKLDIVNFDHSFVLKHSEPVAELVTKFIKTKV